VRVTGGDSLTHFQMRRMFPCHAFLLSHKIYANRIMEYMCLRVSGSAEHCFFLGGGRFLKEKVIFFGGWVVESFVKGGASSFRGVGRRCVIHGDSGERGP
jgi:hypothetical protein